MNKYEFAEKYNRPDDNNFAIACINGVSVSELLGALDSPPDASNMAAWDIIDPREWVDAISTALHELRK